MAEAATTSNINPGDNKCPRKRPINRRLTSYSDAMYGSSDQVGSMPNVYRKMEAKDQHTEQSRRLPYWMWLILSQLLGIRLTETSRPLFGAIMFILTIVVCILTLFSHAWYTVCDVKSKYTKQTVLTGCVTMAIFIYWLALGLYGNRLAKRLFRTHRFAESVRLHSKTMLKVSSASLLIVLGVTHAVTFSVRSFEWFSDENCEQINVSIVICRIQIASRIAYQILSMIWNLLVGIVLLSVCRTHTIAIRRFIREMEEDGRLYETLYYSNLPKDEDMQDEIWEIETLTNDDEVLPRIDENSPLLVEVSDGYVIRRASESQQGSASSSVQTQPTVAPICDEQILQVEDIFQRYWKISVRLRLTGLFLQRWIIGWVLFIMTWAFSRLVYWSHHEPSLLGLLEFILPILFLPVICSALSEVNLEGRRVVTSIRPTTERMDMLLVLMQQPLEFSTFGFQISYATIGGTLAAIAFAFVTRILLDEIHFGPAPQPSFNDTDILPPSNKTWF